MQFCLWIPDSLLGDYEEDTSKKSKKEDASDSEDDEDDEEVEELQTKEQIIQANSKKNARTSSVLKPTALGIKRQHTFLKSSIRIKIRRPESKPDLSKRLCLVLSTRKRNK